MKVFVFDYAAAGGGTARALPASLRHQGGMMLQALMADLRALPEIELITLADAGQPLPGMSATGFNVAARKPFAQRFAACVLAADAVWPVAPVAGRVLENLSSDILDCKRVLLGSAPGAVRVASSKLLTARALAQAGIAAVATCLPGETLSGAGAWVVKPDNGAGCLNTRIFTSSGAALAWIDASGEDGFVLQRFIPGKVGSLSLLCRDGEARVLACNELRMAVRDNQFYFLGSTVNSLNDDCGEFDRLAQQVAAALPGLWGYVGVDFILTEDGPVVLEVNPRLTISYAGLRASLGHNPARLVLDLLHGHMGLPGPFVNRTAVSVDVDAFSLL